MRSMSAGLKADHDLLYLCKIRRIKGLNKEITRFEWDEACSTVPETRLEMNKH